MGVLLLGARLGKLDDADGVKPRRDPLVCCHLNL
jgi:hypothetical protein